jgi:hypothetical protein
MFYNSKKLIDEKVLQQYFFERFMTTTTSERRRLVPEVFNNTHSLTTTVKVLRPEVKLTDNFIVDFVLYPTNGGTPLNIEVKWKSSDFVRQTNRHEWFNGQSGLGFLVVLKNDATTLPDNIPVICLEVDDFQDWFIENSATIVAQALHRKFDTPIISHSGPSNWLIYVGSKSKEHYCGPALANGIWAFKDRNPPNRTMRIVAGDNILFVRAKSSAPPRMFVPDNEPEKTERTSTHNQRLYENDEIQWALSDIDCFRVREGYHMDFSNTAPYNVFESAEWRANAIPELKEYTQYIRFDPNHSAYIFSNEAPAGHLLTRRLFPHKSESLRHFVRALRTAAANRGDVVQISNATMEAVDRLLPRRN